MCHVNHYKCLRPKHAQLITIQSKDIQWSNGRAIKGLIVCRKFLRVIMHSPSKKIHIGPSFGTNRQTYCYFTNEITFKENLISLTETKPFFPSSNALNFCTYLAISALKKEDYLLYDWLWYIKSTILVMIFLTKKKRTLEWFFKQNQFWRFGFNYSLVNNDIDLF